MRAELRVVPSRSREKVRTRLRDRKAFFPKNVSRRITELGVKRAVYLDSIRRHPTRPTHADTRQVRERRGIHESDFAMKRSDATTVAAPISHMLK